MVRSLYSGVTGMKGHQTRLDVIGNNIANVNTMGFKSSVVTFRDVYYQSLRGAAGGNGTRGGVNPSMVGYGSKVSSIDLNMTQSISSTTGNPWDVSIGGEGFFQVQDSNGNIFYTRSGKLGYDNMGYLVDSNGNYVLGTAAQGNKVVGLKPGSSRIQMNIPALNPTQPSATNTINNIQYTITASNTTTDGNVSMVLLSGNLPAGVKAEAVVTSTGITVTLNRNEIFANIGELNNEINKAITGANNGNPHPGGTFTISSIPAPTWKDLTGAQICETPGANLSGTASGSREAMQSIGFDFANPPTGDEFYSGGDCDGLAVKYDATTKLWEISMKVGTATYSNKVSGSALSSGKVRLLPGGKQGARGDYITLVCPNEQNLIRMSDEYAKENADPNAPEKMPDPTKGYTIDTKKFQVDPDGTPANADNVMKGTKLTDAAKSDNLGLASQPFTLAHGTEGGPQTLADISNFKINANGVIEATQGDTILELGRIDLATFDNPSALEQVGSTYFANTGNTGNLKIVEPGMGGSGALASSTLEMSNVDLGQEFADVITTQRGYQANARMITVSDTLLEELINLKRS